MNVLINATYLRPGQVGGSETYVRELARHLAMRDDVHVSVVCRDDSRALFDEPIEVLSIGGGRYTRTKRLAAENIGILRYLAGRSIEVLFSPANFAAPALPYPLPQVATIHDLQHLVLPENFSRATRLGRDFLFRGTIRRCKRLIAISDHTRAQVIERYKCPPEKIVTVYEGARPSEPVDADDIAAARQRLDIERPYFVYPAMAVAHKNHATLLRAFRDFVATDAGVDYILVLCGSRGKYYEKIEAEIENLAIGERVVHLGYLERGDAIAVIAGARGLVFPSLFEGFGLPPVEAMSLEVPVAASDCTSIPEVVGDAAILVPPRDVAGWAGALSVLASDDAERARLIAAGREQAARFTWTRCAEETAAVLEGATKS